MVFSVLRNLHFMPVWSDVYDSLARQKVTSKESLGIYIYIYTFLEGSWNGASVSLCPQGCSRYDGLGLTLAQRSWQKERRHGVPATHGRNNSLSGRFDTVHCRMISYMNLLKQNIHYTTYIVFEWPSNWLHKGYITHIFLRCQHAPRHFSLRSGLQLQYINWFWFDFNWLQIRYIT